MNEYIGMYDEPYIMLHVIKIKANTKEDAKYKFIKYLKHHIYGEINCNCLYIIPLYDLDEIN